MSAFVADPYEIGLLAALVKRIPEAYQPDGVRELNVFQVARRLALENIASVRADRPHGYVPGTPEGIGRAGPNLLDKDVIALAHDAAREFLDAMDGEHPRLIVQPAAAADLARYLDYQSCEHAEWDRSAAHAALAALRSFSNGASLNVREAPVTIAKSEWGLRGELLKELEAKILPEAVSLYRRQAERDYAHASGMGGPAAAAEKPFWEREGVTLTYRDRRAWVSEVNGPGRIAIALDGVSNVIEVESRQIRVQYEGRDMAWLEADALFESLANETQQRELLGRLAASTVTPGRYSPSEVMKSVSHAAVLVGSYAVIMTGRADDLESVAQAARLAESAEFRRMIREVYGDAEPHAGAVDGSRIDWFEGMASLVSKPAGQVEDGTAQGPLVAILTALPGSRAGDALATALAVTAETARIFDSRFPALHDGLSQPPVPPETAPVQEHPPQSSRPQQGRDFRQEITDKMVAALEEGKIPWEKPWRQSERPMNGLSGHRYQGINRFMTMLVAAERGYADPRWLTFRQVGEANGHVRKGEHGVPIEVWKPRPFWERKDVKITLDGARAKVFAEGPGGVEIGASGYSKQPTGTVHPNSLCVEHNGKPLSWRAAHESLDTAAARVFTVFNVEQCEGLDPEKLKPLPEQGPPIDAHTRGEFFMAAMRADGIAFKVGGDGACYVSSLDTIQLPERDRFISQERYYATALHEIGHATGAAQRLAREGITGEHRFGSEGYAREELRAELASAFLSAETGIAGRDGASRPGSVESNIENQHKAYLQSWAKVLKADKNEFFRAAKEAGEAADYVLVRERELEQALEHAGVTPHQASVIEAACAQHDLQECGGVIDGRYGELLRIESSANGDFALRDPATREPLGTVASREAALSRALGERHRAVTEDVATVEAEEGVER
ncbi:MAG: zincin-like metallopeptidase domain-containing protein [Pseudomonadota bacterium]|jgi:antirestriction protein ArdC|nr:zincin-like metallopeptidase domain-containing protein [Pseudomonadota bacterium]